MSSNDNAMTRFLFAILKQKNLKDIDWNKVAHDPILAQEITNGHAARMRYSRFRSAMLGLEPQRRNRKNKVIKPKKEPRSRRGSENEFIKGEPDQPVDGDRMVKPDPGSLTAVKIFKKEMGVHPYSEPMQYESQFMLSPETAGTQHSPHQTSHHEIRTRMLTPSSETDILRSHAHITAATVAGSSESLMGVGTGFDLGSTGHDQSTTATTTWAQMAPDYSTNFDAAFYAPNPSSSHEHPQQHQDDLMVAPDQHSPVKHESNWEGHFPSC